jgi:hypothetical protein
MSGVVEKLEERAVEAERDAARLRKMVEFAAEVGEEGLAELVALIDSGELGNGHKTDNGNSPTPTPGIPRGREAVRRIVERRPGVWTLAELRAEMKREGWFTSAKGLEAAAKRLCDVNREGRRIGRGRFVFPANHGEEDGIESDRSGAAMIASQP